jgi:hypothetical protein
MIEKIKTVEKIIAEMPANRRLFFLSSGKGWAGKILSNNNSRLVLKDAFPFHGTPAGWPDLAGWTIEEVTEDMIGKKIAIFTGLDIKKLGELTHHQKIFKSILEQMGGIYEVYDG